MTKFADGAPTVMRQSLMTVLPLLLRHAHGLALSPSRRLVLRASAAALAASKRDAAGALAAAAASATAPLEPEEVLIDLDPGGLVWTGLDVDDDFALLMAVALNRTAQIKLVGVTVCGGNAPIKHTAPGLDLLLRTAGIGSDDLPMGVAHGVGWRDMHVAWPKLRMLDRLSPDAASSDAAADLIIRAARASGPAGLTVLTLGPPSNLARALAKEPGIAGRLRRAVLMGGELTGAKMDLNFASDRAAARAVIEAPLPTTIVPIQTCAQAAFTADDVDALDAACRPPGDGRRPAAACALVRKASLQARVMPWLVNQRVAPKLAPGSRWEASAHLSEGFIPWDVVALFAAFRPSHFAEWSAHRVRLPACDDVGRAEPCGATMAVDPTPLPMGRASGSGGADREAWRGVAMVPHRLRSEAALLREASELLGVVRAAEGVSATPPLLLGFAKEMSLLAAGALGALGALRVRV